MYVVQFYHQDGFWVDLSSRSNTLKDKVKTFHSVKETYNMVRIYDLEKDRVVIQSILKK